MPRPQGDLAPIEYVVGDDWRGVDWAKAPLIEGAPVSARYAQVFALRLAEVIAGSGKSINALGATPELGVGRKTIERVLAGAVVPTFGAIARLEAYFDVDLWPGERGRRDVSGG